MKKTYLDTPDAALALNYKVGSASLSRAVIAAHHPDVELMLHTPAGTGKGTAYPAGKSADDTRWQGACPKVDPKDRPTTLLLVRDPIEKFRSACVEEKVGDVDAKLAQLEAGDFRGVHFLPQSRLLEGNEIKLYIFPADLEDLATEAGLAWPLPDIDGGNVDGDKPTLTPEQTSRLEAIYADDIALYESIAEAGQAHTPEPVPESAPYVPYRITAWQAKAALAMTPHGESTALAAVEAVIAEMEDGPEKVVVKAAWDNNAAFERQAPTILSIGTAIGLSSEQLDALFILGGSLEV